jgi:hypothetical protein
MRKQRQSPYPEGAGVIHLVHCTNNLSQRLLSKIFIYKDCGLPYSLPSLAYLQYDREVYSHCPPDS